ncbi:hypothetical protein MPTA5024_06330 [Microbispora sp. ATCC PTA-5024]|nr:hypothetical protein MPTA5024_06330 [Microbispora sp. ATCC PTA-5024]
MPVLVIVVTLVGDVVRVIVPAAPALTCPGRRRAAGRGRRPGEPAASG